MSSIQTPHRISYGTCANDAQYGLGASVWGPNVKEAAALGSKSQSGSTWINTHLEVDVGAVGLVVDIYVKLYPNTHKQM